MSIQVDIDHTSALSGGQSFMSWIYVAFLFVTTTFFFFDPTAYMPKIIVISCAWLLLIMISLHRTFFFHNVFLWIFCYLVLSSAAKFNGSELYSILDLVYIPGLVNSLFLLYFLSEERQMVLKSVDRYNTIFVLFNLPSILFFFVILFKINIDYTLIHLGGRDLFYRNYYNLAIFGDYQVLQFGKYQVARNAGMFEEAGMLGTNVAFLLTADLILFPKKGWRIALLLALGLLSLSFAFYIYIFFMMMFQVLKNGNLLKGIKYSLVGGLIVVLLTIVLPVDIKNAFSNLILERFAISHEGVFEGDTRHIEFSKRYSEYLDRATTSELLFGHGAKSNRLDLTAQYSSYQGIVYEEGFLGLFFVVIFSGYFFLWLPITTKNYSVAILGTFCLLSLYQRPDPLSTYFFIVYAAMFITLKSQLEKKEIQGVLL